MTDIVLEYAGTTFNEAITLLNNATPPAPIDCTLAQLSQGGNIIYIVTDPTGRVVIRKHQADSGIVVSDPTGYDNSGNIIPQFTIYLFANDTSPAFGVGSTTEIMTYHYELRVVFADNTQEVVRAGNFVINPTTSWESDVQTSGADRVVYVQGRY